MTVNWHLAQTLHDAGVTGEMLYSESGFKGLMRQAGRYGARYCLILGPDEAAGHNVVVKNMESGVQECVSQDRALQYLQTGNDK
ncbi:MAG: hypothetical protein J5861_04915 [Desulfovibrio sp.]|nr:hypothetical protein [Desulfovibrio sp.]